MENLPLFKKPNKDIRDELEYTSYDLTYPSQNFVLSYMHPHAPYKGLMLAYQLGNGKTYCAAALAHLYNKFGFGVLFLTHNVGTINNFKRELAGFLNDHRLPSSDMCVEYMGLTKFASDKPNIDGKLVIIDEAHNLRETAARYPDVQEILDDAKNIKILIVTATPMIDQVFEIESLKQLIENDAPIAYCKSRWILANTEYIGHDFGFGTLYVSEMRGMQREMYLESVSRKTKDVYAGTRQLALSSGKYCEQIPLEEQSSKMNAILNLLERNHLSVIFSFYVVRGVDFIRDVLLAHGFSEWTLGDAWDENKRRFAIITGHTPQGVCNEIIESFNSLANMEGNIIEILIGSSVVNESITLKNVRHAHIVTPFWNYGQMQQAIGRVVRIGSHAELPEEERNVNVYLHAAIVRLDNSEIVGIDLEMYETAWTKRLAITDKFKQIEEESIWPDDFWSSPSSVGTVIPVADGNMIIDDGTWIWDFRNCFDTNKYKISWCKIKRENVIGYHKETSRIKIGSFPTNITIHEPYETGVTAWISCVDGQTRITNNDDNPANRRQHKRGKLISNLTVCDCDIISKLLGTKPTIANIIQKLKQLDRFIHTQITTVRCRAPQTQ